MDQNTGRPGEEEMDELNERDRQLASGAAHDLETARREEAAGPGERDRDYGFRLPPEIQAGDRARAEGDVRTFQRQEAAAEGQMEAAETLRANAEALRQSAERLRETQQAVRENARDVQDVAHTAQVLRHSTEQILDGVRRVPAEPVADDRGGGGGEGEGGR